MQKCKQTDYRSKSEKVLVSFMFMQLGNHRFQWSDIVNCISVITCFIHFYCIEFVLWGLYFQHSLSKVFVFWLIIRENTLVVNRGVYVLYVQKKITFQEQSKINVCQYKSTSLPSLNCTFNSEYRVFITITTRWSGEGFPHLSHSCMTNGVSKPWPFMTWKG